MKVLSTKSSGVDFVDLVEVKRRGIPLGHTPNAVSEAVADIAVGLMIAAARRFREGFRLIETGNWNRTGPLWMLGQEIRGSTVGVVGLGGIGQTIVSRLKSFNVGKFLYSGHSRKTLGKNIFYN